MCPPLEPPLSPSNNASLRGLVQVQAPPPPPLVAAPVQRVLGTQRYRLTRLLSLLLPLNPPCVHIGEGFARNQ